MLPVVLIASLTAAGGVFDKIRKPEAAPAAPPVDIMAAPVEDGAWPELELAPPDHAERSASGLSWIVVSTGPDGPMPTEGSRVTVHYQGFTAHDGQQFDSSYERGVAATFPLTGVIAGWTEGLQRMRAGDRVRFWIPGRLAYGDDPNTTGKPYGTLIFDVELLSFVEPVVRPVPLDVAGPGVTAERSGSGLAWRVLQQGPGGPRPEPSSIVTVHYTGWTTDGQEFDSSWARDQPATFPLDRVIAGWTEGVQQMSVGDVVRFWIPPELAYKDRPGTPQGTLVFDVELLAIDP